MFLIDSNKILTGIALKRTSFSEKDFLSSIVFADRYHPFVFIDYEGKQNLLSPDQLKEVLEQIRHYLVFTISVRSAEFHVTRKYLLENYLRLTRYYPHLTFCIVAGHSAYSSVDLRIPITKAFHYVFSRIRKKIDTPLFLGAENISSNIINQFKSHYRIIIPFFLHGDARALNSTKINPPFAVYTPMTHKVQNKETIKFFTGYLLRRKAIQRELALQGHFPTIRPFKWEEISTGVKKILQSSYQKFILTPENYRPRIQTFLKNGVQLIVANPLILSHYFDLIKNFKIDLIPNI